MVAFCLRSGVYNPACTSLTVAPTSARRVAAGNAERFTLEHPGGMWGQKRTLCFRAGAGEDTGEWVLALRDALAAARAR